MTAPNFKQLRRSACLLTLLMIMADAHATAVPPPEDVLTVPVGQSLLVEYEGVQRVAVGDGKLLEVKILKQNDEILLIALAEGVTDLRLWRGGDAPARYVVQVQGHTDYVSAADISKLLTGVNGVEVAMLGETVVLQGRAKTQSDLERVKAVSKRYPSVYSYVEPPIFEHKPTILLRARLLEVRRSALKDIGISWDQFINGPVFGYLADFKTNPFYRLTNAPDGSSLPLNVGSSGQKFLGISTSLSSTINLLMENGDARVLAEPTLTCVSGGVADFLVGGEVPIPVRDENGTPNVEFKEFGIILRFSPLADHENFIRTDVSVEVSAVDPSISVLGIPGFVTRKTNTRMNVAEGQTMVIAGLVSHQDAKNVRKIPLLGQIPILGELFKSRQFRKQQTELVILVTPEIIDPESPKNLDYQAQFERLARDSKKRLKFSILD